MLYSQKEYELRTKESFENDAEFGTLNEPENGVKAKVLISQLVQFPNSLPLDYMHLICLGIFKSLMLKWFDSSSKNEYFIGKFSFFFNLLVFIY